MVYSEKSFMLKDGRTCIFRSPSLEDAEAMLEYLKICSTQTPFVLRDPDECTETLQQEAQYLAAILASPYRLMIVCEVEGEIAGNCQLSFNGRRKTCHRGSIAIALVKKFWGLGIGTALFHEMIDLARRHGLLQLELEFIEGNQRAQALYEKMGFHIVGVRPNAFRLSDGSMRHEIIMIRQLEP